VCVYLRSSINYKTRNDLVPDGLDAVCLEICKPNSLNFIVASVYRPPDASSVACEQALFELSLKFERGPAGLANKNASVRSLERRRVPIG
jgi:hypothetical protein